MAGFFSKLFGGKGKNGASTAAGTLVQDTLGAVIEKGAFSLEVAVREEKEEQGDTLIAIEFSGEDEELLKDKKGALLDAFQLYVRRVLQHNFPEDRFNVTVDCGGFREENEANLIERAENLKTIAIEQGKSVYYRALPPKDRKVVHQYLAKDPRIKSRSLGEGLYKKIKIFPAKGLNQEASAGEIIGE